jgi:hypothetical protein
VPRSFTTSKPWSRPLRWLAGVGAVALAGAVTALTITAASASAAPNAAPNAKPSPTPSPTPSTPVMLTVTPSPLDFGAQVVGTTSADKSVAITNPSNQPQTLQPLVFVQNDFRLTASDCPTQAENFLLAPGASCTVSFNFTPFSTGIQSINVTLTFTPGGTPAQTLTLTGTGVNAGAQPAVITKGFICGGGVCTLGGQLAGNTVGNFFATQLSATGGTAPYTWSGQAPAGLTIQPDGIIVGTPTHTGTTTFTVTVTDTTGASGTATFSFTVTKPLPCQTGVGNLTEPLSGPALNGQTPSGTATLTNNDGNEDCATSLLTQVSGVNLPDGTQLWVSYDNVPVGMITLNGSSGSMAPYARPNTAYGFDQVRVYTSFPSSGVQPILQGTQFVV